MTNTFKSALAPALLALTMAVIPGQTQAASLQSLAPLASNLQNAPEVPKSSSLHLLAATSPALSRLALSGDSRTKKSERQALGTKLALTNPNGKKNRFSAQFKSLASQLSKDKTLGNRSKRSSKSLLMANSSQLAPIVSQFSMAKPMTKTLTRP